MNRFCLATCCAPPPRRRPTFARLQGVLPATTGNAPSPTIALVMLLHSVTPCRSLSEVRATVDGRACIIQPDVNQVRTREGSPV